MSSTPANARHSRSSTVKSTHCSEGCPSRGWPRPGQWSKLSPVRDLLYQRVLQAAHRRVERGAQVRGVAGDEALQTLQCSNALFPVNVWKQLAGDADHLQLEVSLRGEQQRLTWAFAAALRATTALLQV